MRNYVGYGKATQSFHVRMNNFVTIKSASVRSKTFDKISRLNAYILFGSGAFQFGCTRHSSNMSFRYHI